MPTKKGKPTYDQLLAILVKIVSRSIWGHEDWYRAEIEPEVMDEALALVRRAGVKIEGRAGVTHAEHVLSHWRQSKRKGTDTVREVREIAKEIRDGFALLAEAINNLECNR